MMITRARSSIKNSQKSPLSTATSGSHVNDKDDSNKENAQELAKVASSPPVTRKRRLFAKLSLDGVNNLQNSQQLESLAIATCFTKRVLSSGDQSPRLNSGGHHSLDNDHYIDIFDWFNVIRSCFHRSFIPSSSSILSSRSTELDFFELFWSRNITKHDSEQQPRNACLFVTGPPGCGKSAFVHDFISRKSNEKIKIISINCLSISDVRRLYQQIFEHLDISANDSSFSFSEILAKELSISETKIVLVLDEVDHLFNVFKANRFDDKNNLLVNLVKWTQLYKMNLTVIGIANSLDLIDRCSEAFSLADIQTPNHCPFSPLTYDQLVNVVSTRISDAVCNNKNLTIHAHKKHLGFHPLALELCSRKFSTTGDIRKVFDIFSLAVDIAEREYVASGDALSHLVSYSHIQQVTTPTFGKITTAQFIELPLQHQVILLAVLLLESEELTLTFQAIYAKYQWICLNKSLQIPSLDYLEFCQVVQLLEGKGLLKHCQSHPSKTKTSIVDFYQLRVSKHTLLKIITDVPLLCPFVIKN